MTAMEARLRAVELAISLGGGTPGPNARRGDSDSEENQDGTSDDSDSNEDCGKKSTKPNPKKRKR